MQRGMGGALTETRMASKAVLLLTTLCIVANFISGSVAQSGSRPMIRGDMFFQDLNEDTPINTTVISTESGGIKDFTVTDEDSLGDVITFTLNTTTSSPNAARFSLNRNSGALVVTESLDVDSLGGTMDTIIFNITACDIEPPVVECPSIQVTITISATNDNSPQFSESDYRVSYSTTTPVGTVLLTANCTDADRGMGEFSGIEFSSPPNNPQMWSLNRETGELTLQQRLDYNTNQRHTLMLRCFDTGSPVKNDNAVVCIEVERNDPPAFQRDRYSTTSNEDSEVGSVIAQLACNDNEKDLGGYELLNPSPAVEETFALNNTGELTLRKSFDICEQTRYEFQVVCLDSANQMDNATVEISVEYGALYFENCTYTFSFDRLTMPNSGEEIGRVRAVGRGIIEYSLEDNQFFVIDASTGRIFSSNYILLFQGNTINLQVQARTSIGQASDMSTVIVNVRGPLSFLEIYIIAAACAALVIILLICFLTTCCCCCFRSHKNKHKDEELELAPQHTTTSVNAQLPFRSSVTIPEPKQQVTQSGLQDDDAVGKSTEDLMKSEQLTELSKIPEAEKEGGPPETQEVSYIGEVTTEEGEKLPLMGGKSGEEEKGQGTATF